MTILKTLDLGKDAYGCTVKAEKYRDYAGRPMWRIKILPFSQLDDGNRHIEGLSDENFDLIAAEMTRTMGRR